MASFNKHNYIPNTVDAHNRGLINTTPLNESLSDQVDTRELDQDGHVQNQVFPHPFSNQQPFHDFYDTESLKAIDEVHRTQNPLQIHFSEIPKSEITPNFPDHDQVTFSKNISGSQSFKPTNIQQGFKRTQDPKVADFKTNQNFKTNQDFSKTLTGTHSHIPKHIQDVSSFEKHLSGTQYKNFTGTHYVKTDLTSYPKQNVPQNTIQNEPKTENFLKQDIDQWPNLVLPYHEDRSTGSGSLRSHSRTSSANTSDFQAPIKPRIATKFWEDENTVCYQVRARGVLVSRREDTNFINGTKLLNVIGMTRGKRDGILKTEKVRKVVKVGLMNLKGVWIPFERALEIARNEGIDSLLYPLFVRDLKNYYLEGGYRLLLNVDDDNGEMSPEKEHFHMKPFAEKEHYQGEHDKAFAEKEHYQGEPGKPFAEKQHYQGHGKPFASDTFRPVDFDSNSTYPPFLPDKIER